MNEATEEELLEIAKACSVSIMTRGDLKRRNNDTEDFISVPVWAIERMLRKAYKLGQKDQKVRQWK